MKDVFSQQGRCQQQRLRKQMRPRHNSQRKTSQLQPTRSMHSRDWLTAQRTPACYASPTITTHLRDELATQATAAEAAPPSDAPRWDSKSDMPQKWVQCSQCEQWRRVRAMWQQASVSHVGMPQVPYNIEDADISDDWTCADNQWDPAHNSCTVPQELSNDQIDQILHAQVCPIKSLVLYVQHASFTQAELEVELMQQQMAMAGPPAPPLAKLEDYPPYGGWPPPPGQSYEEAEGYEDGACGRCLPTCVVLVCMQQSASGTPLCAQRPRSMTRKAAWCGAAGGGAGGGGPSHPPPAVVVAGAAVATAGEGAC